MDKNPLEKDGYDDDVEENRVCEGHIIPFPLVHHPITQPLNGIFCSIRNIILISISFAVLICLVIGGGLYIALSNPIPPSTAPEELEHEKNYALKELKPEKKTEDIWALAININPSDGNDASWGNSIWYGTSNVGTLDRKYSHDYKDYSAWQQPFECLAIVRHNAETYDGVKVWKMNESKAFKDHFNSKTHNDRAIVTDGGPVQFARSPSARSVDIDPILASLGVNNNIAFNWRYDNNGARVVLTDVGNESGTLSSVHVNDDGSHGLGNEFGASTERGYGSTEWWHDASILQPYCHGDGERPCKVQGTDHGTRLSTGAKLGNYALFIANALGDGNCPLFPFDDDRSELF